VAYLLLDFPVLYRWVGWLHGFDWRLWRLRRWLFNQRLVFGQNRPRRGLLRKRHFTFATVAAPEALFTKMIVAGVFGAARADPG
jgi:hypothetical protein